VSDEKWHYEYREGGKDVETSVHRFQSVGFPLAHGAGGAPEFTALRGALRSRNDNFRWWALKMVAAYPRPRYLAISAAGSLPASAFIFAISASVQNFLATFAFNLSRCKCSAHRTSIRETIAP
jgi:hypothetical protein